MRNLIVTILTRFVSAFLRQKGVSGLHRARFIGVPVVTLRSGSTINIGDNFVAVSWSRMQVIGVNHPTIIRTVQGGAEVDIGVDCGVSGATIVAARSIRIGNGCLIGANAMVVDTDFHQVHSSDRRYLPLPKPQQKHSIVIGDNVFIGANAMILKGSRIGDNSVVGAGAVVSGEFGPDSIIAGNPAASVGIVSSEKALGKQGSLTTP
ncbi:acyltransferase [Arthrobacter sp. NtRootA1]|uniref:acyltransferase n=1 Tax=Arthrobacter sp. NtRootA1 TaxID=2830983 RepID=UPI001CC6BC3A|nr:acyltransferase [Arthrobacter sp. NtRootA1]